MGNQSRITICGVKNLFGAAAICIPMALLTGTGGHSTGHYLLQRRDAGYAPAMYIKADVVHVLAAVRSPAQNLDHIRSTLKLTVTDIAARMGVSRQAIYDWQNGKPIADENAAKLDAAARAADMVIAAGFPSTSLVLNRKIMNGKTLADFAFESTNIERAVGTLVQTLQREAAQRALLDRSLARTVRRPATPFDYGAPALEEDG